jgi:hypothetical protein
MKKFYTLFLSTISFSGFAQNTALKTAVGKQADAMEKQVI